jgi:uncharacterized repeat protein (TIGR03803 family)
MGGTNGGGTVFEITPAGKLTTLHSFCSEAGCADGQLPYAGLMQATNGNFYGTTSQGGNSDYCPNQSGCGTVFEITPAGKLTTLYSFCSEAGCADGQLPYAGLMQATNGNFYGTTSQGSGGPVPFGSGWPGYDGPGTVFEITPAGKLTTLYSFCSQPDCTDGDYPSAGLMQATNGNLYGTAEFGGGKIGACGLGGCGTVFSLSVGLKPFVETLPGASKVGAEVEILGNKLTGASSVTFNGTPAQFLVKSPTLILARVPTGAATGYVTVTTPTGVLTSNVPFRVIP